MNMKVQALHILFNTNTHLILVLPNGVVLETKGYWRPEDRRKVRQVIEENPDIDLRMVFQDPYKKISKKSKTTYAKWCSRYGIKWCAFHAIPIDWLT